MGRANKAILVADIGGILVEANDAAGLLFGVRADDMIGRPLPDVLGIETVLANPAGDAAPLEAPQRFDAVPIVRQGEDVLAFADISIARVTVGDAAFVLAIDRDVTGRVVLEQKRQQASRMEAVGQRTPAMPCLGAVRW